MDMQLPDLNQLIKPTIFFFIALILRSIFSFLETSITALRLFKLKELAKKDTYYQGLFKTLEKTPHRILITILIANSFADVICAALATDIMEKIFRFFYLSSNLGFTFGVAIASIAIVTFGEILPKNFARSHGERIFKSMLWIINIVFYFFSPLASILTQISNVIANKLSSNQENNSDGEWISSEKEIRFLIDYVYEKGIIGFEKTEMLQNIFELGLTPVKEIMSPATDIVSVDLKNLEKEAPQIFSKHYFSRLPVYEEKQDNIIGMVHLKDIFVLISGKKIDNPKEIIRPIMFVPESMKINQLLREFRQKRMHIAIVLNEHGIITGLITLEDVLEEIVGEISDEHEPVDQKIISLKGGSWLVDAGSTLEDLQDLLGISFQSEDSITIAGFIAEQLQHLPKKGERIFYKDYYFEVQKGTMRRVQKVLIFRKKLP